MLLKIVCVCVLILTGMHGNFDLVEILIVFFFQLLLVKLVKRAGINTYIEHDCSAIVIYKSMENAAL